MILRTFTNWRFWLTLSASYSDSYAQKLPRVRVALSTQRRTWRAYMSRKIGTSMRSTVLMFN